jgi:hypothetical protein
MCKSSRLRLHVGTIVWFAFVALLPSPAVGLACLIRSDVKSVEQASACPVGMLYPKPEETDELQIHHFVILKGLERQSMPPSTQRGRLKTMGMSLCVETSPDHFSFVTIEYAIEFINRDALSFAG